MSIGLAQARFTFWTVLAALGILLVAFLVTVNVFRDAEKPVESIVAVLGAITGVLGTLAGYVAGQSGKAAAEQRASKAEQRLTAVLDKSDRGVLDEVRAAQPQLFM